MSPWRTLLGTGSQEPFRRSGDAYPCLLNEEMGLRGQETGPTVSKQSSEVRNGTFHERKPGLKDIKARALLITVPAGWRNKNTHPGSPEEHQTLHTSGHTVPSFCPPQ